MTTYFDSSALVAVYVTERFSDRALDLACDRFVSGDDRQLRLARAAGLKVVDSTAPVSRIRRPRRKASR